MITRYRIFGISLTVRSGEEYTSRTVLKEFDGYSVVKEEVSNETCYSLYSGDCQLGLIRGDIEDGTFHIGRIENTTHARVPASKTLPKILEAMESDLVADGVKRLTATALVRIAHIAVRRYGFTYKNGKPRLDLLKWFPGRAVGLEKMLA